MSPPPSPVETVSAIVRQSLSGCVRKTFGTLNPGVLYEDNWHIEAMTYALDRLWRGETTRLIITVPPRHLKSICTSVAFPAWGLGQKPGARFIVASYGAELALKHSRDFRLVLEAPWYRHAFPDLNRLKKETEKEIVTHQNGFRLAASLGGTITGLGAHFVIIDDLMKATDAGSPVERQRVKDFYQMALFNRLEDKREVRLVVIQQRLHEDDLVGFLLEMGGFEHLNLPAIATEDARFDLGRGRWKLRRSGEVLSPREPQEVLDDIRRSMGPAAFSAQYQQEPFAPGGNLIRWDRLMTYEDAPQRQRCLQVVQSWDLAHTITANSDFSVCTTWSYHEGAWLLLDLVRTKLEYPDLLARVRKERDQWQADVVLVEASGAGIALFQDLKAEQRSSTSRRQRSIWRVDAYTSQLDKETRFVAQLPKLEGGVALLPRSASWLSDLKRELTGFPNARHDDQVDSISQFLERFGHFTPRVRQSICF